MFGLTIELPEERMLLADEAYETTIHVDRGVQVDPDPEWLWHAEPAFDGDAEAGVDAEIAAATSSVALEPSHERSEEPSPFLAIEAELDAEADDDADAEADAAAVAAHDIERVHVPFFAGNPQAELVSGSLGFFRFAQPAGTLGLRPPPIRSNLIGLLAVPPSLGSPDLIRFLGGFMRYVRHMRLVREASPPHGSLLLLQFGTPATAETFRRAYHGKRYNSLEPDVAVAVHVAQVDFVPPPPQSDRAAAPAVCVSLGVGCVEPAEPRPAGVPASAAAAAAERLVAAGGRAPPPDAAPPDAAPPDNAPVATASANGVRVSAQLQVRLPTRNLRPSPPPPQPVAATAQEALAQARGGRRAQLAPLPLGGLLGPSTELPSCAVCLERLDPSISGIYTLLCSHSFHSACLRRWEDSSCPVCRHVLEEAAETRSSCEACGTSDNLWICLVCGHVGCGRYGCGAGVTHNGETSHNFAMEVSTQRVWDYAGDNYVHRLIQNKVDGKLVELPDPGRHGAGSGLSMEPEGGASSLDRAALELKQRSLEQEYEAVEHEYSALLAGQLEAQRAHYEAAQAALLQETHESFEARIAAAEATEARAAQQESLARELTRRLADREKRLKSLEEERAFEASLNEQLVCNQAEHKKLLDAAQAREAALQAKLADMEEQQRDLTFHFEAQLKIAQEAAAAGCALAGGDVELPAAVPQRGGKARAKRRSS